MTLADPAPVLSPPKRIRTKGTDVPLEPLRTSRLATFFTFLCSDVAAFATVLGLTHALFHDISAVARVAAALGVVALALALFGLYRTVPLHPAQELQRACLVITVTFAAFATPFLLSGSSGVLPLCTAWLVTIIVLPTCRILSRVTFSKTSWWGAPVLVIGSSGAGEAVVTTLKRWPELGLKPIALLRDNGEPCGEVAGVPVLGKASISPQLAHAHSIRYAVVAMPDLSHRQLVIKLGSYAKFFKHIFVASGPLGAHSLWAATSSRTGLVGYETLHSKYSAWVCFGKRLIDFIGAVVGLLLLAPLFLTLAILIKLDSPGPIFFRQTRMGREGRCFDVFKFRSMYENAEEKLHDILREDPVRREEYEVFHKLRDDPRITRIGRVLRRSSLDELPQLLNVFRGDLSLVGPRAYMPRELPKMIGLERAVLQNRPGLTGLWQVSGRNELQFQERVYLDVHYTQNCSFWMDAYILIKTIPVVLTGNGAS